MCFECRLYSLICIIFFPFISMTRKYITSYINIKWDVKLTVNIWAAHPPGPLWGSAEWGRTARRPPPPVWCRAAPSSPSGCLGSAWANSRAWTSPRLERSLKTTHPGSSIHGPRPEYCSTASESPVNRDENLIQTQAPRSVSYQWNLFWYTYCLSASLTSTSFIYIYFTLYMGQYISDSDHVTV